MTTESTMPAPMAETPGQVGAVADNARPSKSLYRDLPTPPPRPVNGKVPGNG